jgi:hypothetical protein
VAEPTGSAEVISPCRFLCVQRAAGRGRCEIAGSRCIAMVLLPEKRVEVVKPVQPVHELDECVPSVIRRSGRQDFAGRRAGRAGSMPGDEVLSPGPVLARSANPACPANVLSCNAKQ